MTLTHLIAPAAVLAVFTLIAAPAQAQRRGGDGRGRSVARSRAVEGVRAERGNRSSDRTRFAQPTRPTDWRGERGYQQMPRAMAAPRVIAPRGRSPRIGSFNGRRPVVVDPYRYRTYGARPSLYRPSAFRPRFRIGVGVFGYAVPYPSYDPYAYAAPPAYDDGYPARITSAAPTSAVAYGGVSFEITPGEAAVYADGVYVGPVSDFSDPSRPLSLTAGTHQIELQAPGFAPAAFDMKVEPGQVIPYRADLQPIQ